MANDTGIFSIVELLNSRFAANLAVGFGFDTISEILRQDLEQWNKQVTDQMESLTMITTDRQGLTGTSTDMAGSELDEFGSGKTKVERPGNVIGFPMKRYGYPTGFTQRYMRMATVSDLAIKAQQVQQAFKRDIRFNIRNTIFGNVNTNPRDIHVDNQVIPVKAFWNADGDIPPDSPQDGTAFAGTHQHYTASATFVLADLVALIDNVAEHGVNNELIIAIHKSDIADWTALTEAQGFVIARFPSVAILNRGEDNVIQRPATRTNDFVVGSLNGADVWVKPWAVPNYSFCYDLGQDKSIGYRQDVTTGFQGLVLVQDLFLNPLNVTFFEALFGTGVNDRSNGAVHQHDNATYQIPSLNP